MSDTGLPVESEHVAQPFPLWPVRLLGPAPGLKELNLACWAAFLAFLLVPLCFVHWRQATQGTVSIRQLNSDFVYFYGVGAIAHRYSPTRIYDQELQQQVFLSIQPPRNGRYGPSPYSPFVALLCAPFAHFSFETAYLLWFGLSLIIYLVGIGTTAQAVFPGEPLKTSVIACFALAFYPFIFGTLLNGQLSSVAVCGIGLMIYEEKRGHCFRSGIAMSLLFYKPTLLLLLLPMLLLTRRFRTLMGFISGAAILILAATLFAGIGIWLQYADMLRHFARVAGLGGSSQLQLWKYLDLRSFFAAMPDGGSPAARSLLLWTIIVSAATLAILLWRSVARGQPAQWMAYAATLTWTMLLNVYVPIYDSVLVLIAVILTLGALRALEWSIAARWITLLATIVFAASWKTESFAKLHGIQLLTLTLIILGSAQLFFLYRIIVSTTSGLRSC